jgi:hypothetical protein
MSMTDFCEFRELVLQEKGLQLLLRDIEDRDEFVNSVIAIGRECGFMLTRDDVDAAMLAGRRSWIERWV